MTFVQSSGLLLAFLTNAFTIFVEKSPSPVVHAHNGLGTISVCNYNGVLRLTLISFDLYLIPVVFAYIRICILYLSLLTLCVLFVSFFFTI